MAERLSSPMPSDEALLLAIESATRDASVALVRSDDVLAELVGDEGDPHAERLLPMVDAVLSAAGVDLEEVGAFAISIGPGGFTSLRIGLATLKGLAFGRDAPVAAVSTLHALAHAAIGAGRVAEGETALALLDARRGELYGGAYRGSARPLGALRTVVEDGVHDPAALGAALAGPVRIVGEGAPVFGAAVAAAAGRDDVVVDAGEPVRPTAVSVARIGRQILAEGGGRPAGTLVPSYLRRSQAEEERAARGSR